MITYKTGDIFLAKTEAIVNPVNCVGVMGKGLALQFKRKFPNNYQEYASACRTKKITPGKLFITDVSNTSDDSILKHIVNFPTKRHWKNPSRIYDITKGLNSLVKEIEKKKIKSIAIPPLGCSLGSLDWYIVNMEMKKAFKKFQYREDVHIFIYMPKI